MFTSGSTYAPKAVPPCCALAHDAAATPASFEVCWETLAARVRDALGAQEPLADQVRALRHVDAWCEAWQRMLLDPYDEHPATCLSAAASAPALPAP